VEGIDALFELSMENLLKQNQEALVGVSHNFPIPGIGPIMRAVCFPTGQPYKGHNDAQTKKASDLITRPSGIRELLSEGIFISNDPNDRLRMLNDILPKSIAADKIVSAAKKAKRALTVEEQKQVDEVTAVVNRIVQVDAFDKLGSEKYEADDYVRPALRHTKFAAPISVSVASGTA
jgi:hypothetical protein